MNKKLYVGNLDFGVTEGEVRELFSTFGDVEEVKLVTDRYTGRPRGFALVTMITPEAAGKALEALNGQSFKNRNLNIDWARTEPRRDGDRGGFGGNRDGERSSFGGNRGGFGGNRDREPREGGFGGDRRPYQRKPS